MDKFSESVVVVVVVVVQLMEQWNVIGLVVSF
jgi:hypothetical protein